MYPFAIKINLQTRKQEMTERSADNRGIICLSTGRMREQNDGKKKNCLAGCHGYLRVVNLQLRYQLEIFSAYCYIKL